MKKRNLRDGQAMLLAVLTLGGAILGATTIAGLLMMNQLRSTTDFENSAKAIFAADTGVEWALFDFYCGLATPARCANPPPPLPGSPAGTLSNAALVTVTCYDNSGVTVVPCYDTVNAASAISKGSSFNSKRAFFLGLATSTLP